MNFKYNLLFILLALPFFCLGQQIDEMEFANKFGANTYDTIRVVNYKNTDAGLTVYLKMWSPRNAITGMRPPIKMDASAQLVFDNDLNLKSSDYVTYASDSDMASYKIKKAFPGYFERGDAAEKEELPTMYYDNRIKVKFSQMPKEFVQKQFVPNKSKSKVGSFMGIASDYEAEKKEIDMEDFNGSSKKTGYWMRNGKESSDAGSGTVYGLFSFYSKDKEAKDSYMKKFEFWAVDKDAKMINKSAFNFDNAVGLQTSEVYFDKIIQRNTFGFDKGVYVFSEMEGKRYPGGDSRKFYTYFFGADGKQTGELAFEAEEENSAVLTTFNHGENISLFGASSESFMNVVVSESGVVENQAIPEGDELYSRLLFTGSELKNSEISYEFGVKTNAGYVGLYELRKKAASTSGTTSTVSEFSGNMLLYFDGEGKLINSAAIKRTGENNNMRASSLYNLSSNDDTTVLAFVHPVKEDLFTNYYCEVKAISATEPMTELAQVKLVSSSAIMKDKLDSSVFFISPSKGAYKLVRVKF